jgi:pyruvate,orthophosphate dikinase
VQRFKELIKERTGKSFPQDPRTQLWGAIGAVFGSWMNDRAIVYRRKYGIPHDWGTAVNVQTMVFGNMGNTSATGVAFTRDPASGEKVSTANISSTPRAKTLSPACARRIRSPSSPPKCPQRTRR